MHAAFPFSATTWAAPLVAGATSRRYGLRAALAQTLASLPTLTDLIGSRIYYAAIPADETQGAIAYQVIGRLTPGNLDGPDSTGSALLQIAAIGRDSDELEEITTTLRAALDGFEGTALGWTWHDFEAVAERDTWTSPGDGTDTGTHRTILEFSILYTSP